MARGLVGHHRRLGIRRALATCAPGEVILTGRSQIAPRHARQATEGVGGAAKPGAVLIAECVPHAVVGAVTPPGVTAVIRRIVVWHADMRRHGDHVVLGKWGADRLGATNCQAVTPYAAFAERIAQGATDAATVRQQYAAIGCPRAVRAGVACLSTLLAATVVAANLVRGTAGRAALLGAGAASPSDAGGATATAG